MKALLALAVVTFLCFHAKGIASAKTSPPERIGPIFPQSGGAAGTGVEIEKGTAKFGVTRGPVRFFYSWKPASKGGDQIAAVSMHQKGVNEAPVVLRYKLDWVGRAKLMTQTLTKRDGGVTLSEIYVAGKDRVAVVTRVRIVGGSLAIDLSADQPALLALLMIRPTGAHIAKEVIPYSPINAYRVGQPTRFYTAFFDWTASAATTFENDSALYRARTDGTRNALHERIVLTMSDSFTAVMPVSGWSRSRFYKQVAGRMMVDISETLRFAEIDSKLEGLIAAGLSNCVVIVHAWQRLGYDNGLPTVLPANDYLGGGDIIRRIAKRAADARCLFALHQNYIDYYPNAEGFDPNLIALDGNGQRVAAWYNSAVGIGSFSVKPSAFARLASNVAPEIHATLGTTASFIDVNSGYLPWQRVDMDAREADGGRFSPFLGGSKALFELMQRTESGPVFGEGHYNFYWSGAVDGVAAQMTIGNTGDVRTTPMWVDFALRRIRPFQLNFGMGFYDRYAPATPTSRDPLTDEANRDIYRTQQLAYGHMPYRSGILWGDVRLFVQESALAGAVARATAHVDVRSVRYHIGERWIPVEAAFPAARAVPVRIRYANGIVVVANTSADQITDARGTRLGLAAWSATGSAIEARSWVETDGRRDFVRTETMIYADPRSTTGNWSGDGVPNDLADFGILRTDGQVWGRCIAGYWQFIVFALRGHVDLEVADKVVKSPTMLRTADGPAVRPTAAAAGFWRIRLPIDKYYVSDTKCTS